MALLVLRGGDRSRFETVEEARAQAAHEIRTGGREPLEIRDDADEAVLVSFAELTGKRRGKR